MYNINHSKVNVKWSGWFSNSRSLCLTVKRGFSQLLLPFCVYASVVGVGL